MTDKERAEEETSQVTPGALPERSTCHSLPKGGFTSPLSFLNLIIPSAQTQHVTLLQILP